MIYGPVDLEQMLSCREMRVKYQNELMEKHKCPVVCFTLNIPGPLKVWEEVEAIFEEGKSRIYGALSSGDLCTEDSSHVQGIEDSSGSYGTDSSEVLVTDTSSSILEEIEIREATGLELYLSVNMEIKELKKTMLVIEEMDKVARIFDIDVLGLDGLKISREEFGYDARMCFLCNEQSQSCARNRTHTVEEIITYINQLAREIG